ncbi:dehydrodolichyl diphosphate synthase complex subunit DHDDS-like isoform X1 [Rhipicephalus microplus]|uniref:dehydrodolichyl diphosphate synthase complex subunit DHDDS-like isoform X1 n=1 Tax=Rhipicephalus microplus TaxID=6941 RepID=UPI003F6CB36A
MFEKTTLMCQYMVKLGVEDISYGILSIRNFYRDASEVNAVLSAMANFYRTALCNTNSLQRINLLVSTIGDMNMHPEELQSDMAQVEIVTANEGWTRKCRLFSAYTSRSELTKVIVHMANAVVKERHQKTFSSSHDMDPHKIFRQRKFLRSLKLWKRRSIGELLSLKCTQKKKRQ